MPWIHVDDGSGWCIWALDGEDRSGVYNATAPNPVTNARALQGARHGARPPRILPVPKLAMKARFGSELGEVITGGQRAVPRRALDGGFEFAEPEIEPALRNLLRR